MPTILFTTSNLQHADWQTVDGSLDLGLSSVAGWGEDTEIVEPCAAVELGVDGVDQPWLVLVALVAGDFQDDDTGDLLLWLNGAWSAGLPSESDKVASVPHVESLEWDVWLRALAGLEGLKAGEGSRSERLWAIRAAVVDELVHRVGVVSEVLGEVGFGRGVGVVGDEGAEVVGDLLSTSVVNAATLTSSSSERGSRGKANKASEECGAHLDYVVVGIVSERLT